MDACLSHGQGIHGILDDKLHVRATSTYQNLSLFHHSLGTILRDLYDGPCQVIKHYITIYFYFFLDTHNHVI